MYVYYRSRNCQQDASRLPTHYPLSENKEIRKYIMLRNSLRNSIPSTGGSSMVRRHLTKIFAAANQRPAKKATRGFHIRKSCRLVWDFVMFGNKRH